jgi:hypothetical protein
MELGRILKVFAVAPRYHSTEDGRWDYRATIIFKNAEIAHDTFDSGPLLKQLFHDQETYNAKSSTALKFWTRTGMRRSWTSIGMLGNPEFR